jgi:hypothetical protein
MIEGRIKADLQSNTDSLAQSSPSSMQPKEEVGGEIFGIKMKPGIKKKNVLFIFISSCLTMILANDSVSLQ